MKSKFLIGFLFGGLGETNMCHKSVCFTRIRDLIWRVSNSEELVGLFTGDCESELVKSIIKYY